MSEPRGHRAGRLSLTGAFAWAALRYWFTVFPQVASELRHWRRSAERIADPGAVGGWPSNLWPSAGTWRAQRHLRPSCPARSRERDPCARRVPGDLQLRGPARRAVLRGPRRQREGRPPSAADGARPDRRVIRARFLSGRRARRSRLSDRADRRLALGALAVAVIPHVATQRLRSAPSGSSPFRFVSLGRRTALSPGHESQTLPAPGRVVGGGRGRRLLASTSTR